MNKKAKDDKLDEYLKKIDAYVSNKVEETVSTGFPQLDEIICKGFPIGRSIEIFGDESGGKSSLALAMCGEFIRQGKRCLWVDVEDSYMPDYAERLEVDSKQLKVMKGMDTGEETLDALEEIIKEDMVDVIVVDSMSEIVPRLWLENDLETLPIGRRAGLHSRFLAHTRNKRIKDDISLIMINQTREDPNDTNMFKSRKSTAGTSILHEVSTRIRMSRSHQIKKGEDLIGYRYKAEIIKNKVGPVKGVCTFRYRLASGFDKAWDLLDRAVEKEVIKKDGANFAFNGEKVAYGEENAVEWVRENIDLIKSELT